MKQLWIQRHCLAASSWSGSDDHDRPLAPAGNRDAERAGNQLAQWNAALDRILCSSAERTSTTALLVAQVCAPSLTPRPVRRLYSGSPDTYLEVLRQSGGDADSLLIVGHNPTISMLASLLGRASIGMSPGTIVGVRLELDDWSRLGEQPSGERSHLWVP